MSKEVSEDTEPFGNNVIISDAKLTDYILSRQHRVGANKARVFKAALGIDNTNALVLKEALLEAARTYRPVFSHKDAYGSHYAIAFELSYGKKSAFVRSLWIVKDDDMRAYLVSAFVVTSKRASSEEKENGEP
jgi:hypothetical protein